MHAFIVSSARADFCPVHEYIPVDIQFVRISLDQVFQEYGQIQRNMGWRYIRILQDFFTKSRQLFTDVHNPSLFVLKFNLF